jgi:hypothetical protein
MPTMDFSPGTCITLNPESRKRVAVDRNTMETGFLRTHKPLEFLKCGRIRNHALTQWKRPTPNHVYTYKKSGNPFWINGQCEGHACSSRNTLKKVGAFDRIECRRRLRVTFSNAVRDSLLFPVAFCRHQRSQYPSTCPHVLNNNILVWTFVIQRNIVFPSLIGIRKSCSAEICILLRRGIESEVASLAFKSPMT